MVRDMTEGEQDKLADALSQVSREELTEAQLERQDWVDNCCHGFLQEMAALAGKDIEWDMEHLGEVRLVAQEIVVDKLKLMTEMEFYPYIELEQQPGAATTLKVCEHELKCCPYCGSKKIVPVPREKALELFGAHGGDFHWVRCEVCVGLFAVPCED